MNRSPLFAVALGTLLISCLVAVPVSAQKVDRSAPPKVGPPPVFIMAPIQRFTLSNGLRVVLLEKHEVPLVQINLVLMTGSVMDPEGKTGLASMTAAMVMEGAAGRDALALADAIDYLGAEMSASAGFHTSSVSLQTPLTKLDAALALQADIALRPTFPPAELERNRKDRLTTLLQWRDEASDQASVMFSRVVYGEAHPYGVSAIGDEQAIRSLSIEDLQRFVSRYYRPNNAFLVVVGDVNVQMMKPKLEAAFGAWKAGNVVPAQFPAIARKEKRSVTLVDKPGAAQTEIRIGRVGSPRVTDDYYALVVMNTILGGSFSSRLNQNLRETHGYTYGARSSFAFLLYAGPFLATTAVHTAKTDSALMELFKEIDGMLKPTPAEVLERAKNYVALGFPGDFQTVRDISLRLEEMMIYELPENYFNNYIGRILSVTNEDVQRVAKKYMDPEEMAVVLVGDRKEIQEKVVTMKLGPMQTLTVDDVFGKPPVIEDNK
jgi:predicted Zn-dependent peptidase